jgi:Acetyltransferase (GNAT) domain
VSLIGGLATQLVVRTATLHNLDSWTLESWARLEERALEGNGFLSPHFVLPAARHLSSSLEIIIVLVERKHANALHGDRPELVGVGVFEVHKRSRSFLLCHLKAFRSIHSYVTGVLLDRECAREALEAILHFVSQPEHPWYGLEFTNLPADGALGTLLNHVTPSFDFDWFERGSYERPMLIPKQAGPEYLQQNLKSRTKDAARRWKYLEKLGPVEWRCLTGSDVTAATIENFMDLEHMGWKEEDGTSLRSTRAGESFFREMIDGFRQHGRALFCELLVNGRVIASTSNFCSGQMGFAFKVGWDKEFAYYTPGLVNEVEFIRAAPGIWGHLESVDSGSTAGSFIENYWMARQKMISGTFAWSAVGRAQLSAGQLARKMRDTVWKQQAAKAGSA